MRHRSFGEFVDRKKRESIRHLILIKSLLERQGMKVDNFTESDEDNHDPYIFCHNTRKTGSFDGIRIYEIGDQCCFRVQKESKTHPYGSAYPLPIESMFYDFLSDENVDEKKAGNKVIDSIGKEIRRFFEKSVEADKDDRNKDIDKQGTGNMLIKGNGTDYSAMVYNKN